MLTRLAPQLASEGDAGDAIQHALEAVRKHLGMEVAYVSEFVDGRSIFRKVDAPGLEALIKAGDSQSLDDVYCRHILAGRLPELMQDTGDHAIARDLPITAAVPIGAHVSVPIRLQNGSNYGMFCCLSPFPNASLNDRDLAVMRAFAEMTALQISKEVEAERAIKAARERLDQVMNTKAFAMVYQPIVRFAPHRITGFEALCRFSAKPERTPDLWFNEAAQVGRGVALELCALQRACEAFGAMPSDVWVSMNVSPETILHGELPGFFLGQPLGRLVLEVTEHAPVQDYGALRAALRPLREAGVKLAIDDAGAGFSSLQHIIQLRPEIIKLDMGLVRGVDADPARRALVAALAHFAREIGSFVVAEGIETEAELEALKILGVQEGQGYLIGRPSALPEARAAE